MVCIFDMYIAIFRKYTKKVKILNEEGICTREVDCGFSPFIPCVDVFKGEKLLNPKISHKFCWEISESHCKSLNETMVVAGIDGSKLEPDSYCRATPNFLIWEGQKIVIVKCDNNNIITLCGFKNGNLTELHKSQVGEFDADLICEDLRKYIPAMQACMTKHEKKSNCDFFTAEYTG
jgi:hypothetical protein